MKYLMSICTMAVMQNDSRHAAGSMTYLLCMRDLRVLAVNLIASIPNE
jgi:hypothetical protein